MNRNTTILLVGAMISLALFFGLRSGKSDTPPTQVTNEEAVVPGIEEVIMSIDDDAIRGDKNKAKVAIIEFSDYECPFCKRFTEETVEQLVENYVETGKAIMVFRDLPLPFHEPAASREAMAAECARDQGGDEKYYEFHDAIFAETDSNGEGISETNLGGLADKMGLNGKELISCIKDGKFESEVKADIADASKVGIDGTPGFVIGKLDDNGEVRGEIISGAVPFSTFEAVIEKYL